MDDTAGGLIPINTHASGVDDPLLPAPIPNPVPGLGKFKPALLGHFCQALKIEKLKQFIANFVESRGPVRGGCPVLNTAVDADDGNPVLRARVAKALRTWVGRLEGFVLQAQQQGKASPAVDPKGVAMLIVANLEGALMMSRIQHSDDALRQVQSHLNQYLDREVSPRCDRRGIP